jgi:hypothetical protein
MSNPDGRESGFVEDINGAFGFGHAGMYVKPENGYSFFEVTGIDDGIKEDVEKGNAEILSQSTIAFPTVNLAQKYDFPTEAGVVRRNFDTKEEMDNYFTNNGFDIATEFNTTSEDRKYILFFKVTNGIVDVDDFIPVERPEKINFCKRIYNNKILFFIDGEKVEIIDLITRTQINFIIDKIDDELPMGYRHDPLGFYDSIILFENGYYNISENKYYFLSNLKYPRLIADKKIIGLDYHGTTSNSFF